MSLDRNDEPRDADVDAQLDEMAACIAALSGGMVNANTQQLQRLSELAGRLAGLVDE